MQQPAFLTATHFFWRKQYNFHWISIKSKAIKLLVSNYSKFS